MTITLFILNVIWTFLGIIVFIYSIILMRAYQRNMNVKARIMRSHISFQRKKFVTCTSDIKILEQQRNLMKNLNDAWRK